MKFFSYLATSQRPVAAPGEWLSPVVGGVDDYAVAVVSVLPQGVGDVVHRLVHRGHHGGQLPPGDVGHVPVRVDVGLWRLQWRVNRLQGNDDMAERCVYYFSNTGLKVLRRCSAAFNRPDGAQSKQQKPSNFVVRCCSIQDIGSVFFSSHIKRGCLSRQTKLNKFPEFGVRLETLCVSCFQSNTHELPMLSNIQPQTHTLLCLLDKPT